MMTITDMWLAQQQAALQNQYGLGLGQQLGSGLLGIGGGGAMLQQAVAAQHYELPEPAHMNPTLLLTGEDA